MEAILASVFDSALPVSLMHKLIAAAWTFGVAAFVVLSALGYGTAVAARLRLSFKRDLAKTWSFGLAALSFLSVVISHAGILYPAVVAGICAIGLVLLWRRRHLFSALSFQVPTTKPERLVWGLVFVFVLTRFAESSIPNGQGDPLYYHVAAPYYWAGQHGFVFMDWLPWLLQGGVFEYVYASIAALGGPPMAVLVSCQIVHAFCGVILAPLLCAQIAGLVVRDRVLIAVAVLAFVTIPQDPLVLVRAKNDGFVLLMSLACLSVFTEQLTGNRDDQHGGWLLEISIFAAAALAGKNSSLLLLTPLAVAAGILMIKRKGKTIPQLAVAAGVLILVGGLMLGRNYFYSGNPVFPALDHIFRSPLMNDSIRSEFTSLTKGNPEFLPAVFAQFKAMFLVKPLYVLSLVAVFFAGTRTAGLLVLIALAMLPGMAVTMGDSTASPRMTLAIWCLIAVAAVSVVEGIAGRFAASRLRYLVAAAALVFALVNSKYEIAPVRLFKDVLPYHFSGQSGWVYLREQKTEISVIEWMNQNISGGHILSDNMSEGLFLRSRLSQAWNNLTANETVHAKTVDEFARAFLQAGYTHYLHDRRNPPDRVPVAFAGIEQRFVRIFSSRTHEIYRLR